MFFTYIIKSRSKDWFYVGLTKDVVGRLRSHNKGENESTRPYKPFLLVFVQSCNSRMKARELEKYLKVRFNKESLLRIIGYY